MRVHATTRPRDSIIDRDSVDDDDDDHVNSGIKGTTRHRLAPSKPRRVSYSESRTRVRWVNETSRGSILQSRYQELPRPVIASERALRKIIDTSGAASKHADRAHAAILRGKLTAKIKRSLDAWTCLPRGSDRTVILIIRPAERCRALPMLRALGFRSERTDAIESPCDRLIPSSRSISDPFEWTVVHLSPIRATSTSTGSRSSREPGGRLVAAVTATIVDPRSATTSEYR